MTFNLKTWRRLRGLTQQEMADKMGVSRQIYIRYEKNPENVRYGRIKQIAEILEIEVGDIR